MKQSWGMDLVHNIFVIIDSAIYTLISVTYEILLQIANIKIFSPGAINAFATKIYSLLGLIMLFKVSFSLISYLVNPDDMTDKSKGASKLIVNVLIVLVLIIITPTAFNKLYQVQEAILTDNVLPRFILGTEGDMGNEREYQMSSACVQDGRPKMVQTATDGDYISILTFRPFYQLEQGVNNASRDKYCAGYGTVSSYLGIVNSVEKNGLITNYYIINYQFFLSTAVGIVMLLILVSFCFDIAVRTIQLGFLQIIAPIPIVSYVDPKSGKDGMFKKWLKEVGRTWASLFIRLAALFFAVYIIGLMASDESMFESVAKYKFWVQLFIIIGALMFAKKLPKLLEDILGIKLDSGLTLNPMKKIRDNALGGKMVTGALKGGVAMGAGLAMGSAANLAAIGANWKKEGSLKKALAGDTKGFRGFMRGAGTILGVGAGGISAALHGGYGTFKEDSLKKGIMPGLKKSVDNRDPRDKRQDAGYGLGTRMLDTLKGASGIRTEAKNREIQTGNVIAGLQTAQQNIAYQMRAYADQFDAKQLTRFAQVNLDDQGNYSFIDENNNKTVIGDEAALKQALRNGEFGTIRNVNDAMQYINLQAESNQLSKKISDTQKKQALYQKEDSSKKK